MIRMHVNQPSTLQPLHKLHGTNVLAVPEAHGWRIYFLSGTVISQQAPLSALSIGWPDKMTTGTKAWSEGVSTRRHLPGNRYENEDQ